jgi:hypothetical protein
LDWLKTIDNNLRTQPKHFWKYISKFKRNDQSVTQIEVGSKIITELQLIATYCNLLQLIADVSAVHVSSVFKSSSSVLIPNSSDCLSSDFLNIPYISDSDVQRAISRLRSTKCVGPDEIPNFIIKGCSEVLNSSLIPHFQSQFINWKVSLVMEEGCCCTYFLERQQSSLLVIIDLSRF